MILVRRERIASGGHGFAWYWHYYAIGPDGTRFDNGSIVTLRDVLRRRYGRDIQVSETWRVPRSGNG